MTTLENHLKIAEWAARTIERTELSSEEKKRFETFIRLFILLAKDLESVRILGKKMRKASEEGKIEEFYNEVFAQRL